MRFVLTAAVLVLSLPLAAQTETVEVVRIASGGAVMLGSMFPAEGPGPHPTVILLHGFPGGPVIGTGTDRNVLELGRPLSRAGFNALAFNYRGAWGSGGTYSVAGNLEDVKTVLAYVRQAEVAERYGVDTTKLMLVGHSLGSFNALLTGGEESDIMCTVGIAAGDFGAAMITYLDEVGEVPGADVPMPGLGGYTTNDLIGEIRADQPRFDLRARMVVLKGRPLLFVSASQDDTVVVPIDGVVAAARVAGVEPLDHVVLDANHNFTLDGNIAELSTVVIDWMTEHCM